MPAWSDSTCTLPCNFGHQYLYLYCSWDNEIKAYKRYEKAWVKSALQDFLVAAAVRK